MARKGIFVVEDGKVVFINDRNGLSVTFDSLDEFKRCSGVDLTGKEYIGYEPSINLFVDSKDKNITEKMIPYKTYEDLIAMVPELISRKENPIYGLTGINLFNAQNIVDEQAVRNTYSVDSEAPVEVTIQEGTFTFNGGQDSASYIQGAILLAQNLGESNVTITDINNEPIVLGFESATIVAIEIGKSFREAFFTKQSSLVDIAKRTMK